ncbi:hypothetical protein M427DRAFT_429809 [Gonapodya prolifera JEL478]|uniref:Uncharacterized protein n=1 Tax=Gonapodya prolifera (strain JEL478) TaxID=1344416 RepID=A0A139ASQ7_GONPJ|nr:hypothetical protein M427DRAFT_429809 [Gonapodya prolifera JEL478]|eukprot:KXS19778.1 hypothetical protein M427DRAFT_429809 [Gonapodya prolifera JEL478]
MKPNQCIWKTSTATCGSDFRPPPCRHVAHRFGTAVRLPTSDVMQVVVIEDDSLVPPLQYAASSNATCAMWNEYTSKYNVPSTPFQVSGYDEPCLLARWTWKHDRTTPSLLATCARNWKENKEQGGEIRPFSATSKRNLPQVTASVCVGAPLSQLRGGIGYHLPTRFARATHARRAANGLLEGVVVVQMDLHGLFDTRPSYPSFTLIMCYWPLQVMNVSEKPGLQSIQQNLCVALRRVVITLQHKTLVSTFQLLLPHFTQDFRPSFSSSTTVP